MSIQLFVPTFAIEDCIKEIRDCLEKGWTGLGYKTLEFEKAWCEYTGLKHAHFLSSATAGLHLAVKILKERHGWNEGDEIISTPITFVSTNHAVLYERLAVVFADVDATGCLDPESVLSRITSRTRAVIFVGLGGNSGQLSKVAEICRVHGISLILDAAHMAGTRIAGQHVGAEADATVFSYQAVKTLATADSGMLCFRDEENDAIARQQSWLGINKDTYSRTNANSAYKWQYEVEHVGYKYHGNSIMAAIGLTQIRQLDRDNAFRRQLATWYDNNFRGTHIGSLRISDDCESARHLYQIEVDDRDTVMLGLNNLSIYPGVHYRDNTEFSMYRYANGTCPRAAELSQRVMSLPLHMRMTKKDVDLISEQVLALARPRTVSPVALRIAHSA